MKRLLFTGIAVLTAAGLLAVPALAGSGDQNRDRLPDKWEKRFHLSLKVHQTNRDQDRDGLTNLCEFDEGASPRDADTDDDGIGDDAEVEDHPCGANEPGDDNGKDGPGHT
jgi:hypothetical protein